MAKTLDLPVRTGARDHSLTARLWQNCVSGNSGVEVQAVMEPALSTRPRRRIMSRL